MDLAKHKRDAEEQAREKKRVSKITSQAKVAAAKAGQEYLTGQRTGNPISLDRVAAKHEVTISMVRTEITHQQQPSEVKKSGPRSMLTDRDKDDIGRICIDRAMNDKAVTVDELRGLLLRFVNQGRKGRGQARMQTLGKSAFNRLRTSLQEYWDRLHLPLIVRKKSGSVSVYRRRAEQYAIPAFYKGMEELRNQYPADFDNPANWMNLDEQALSEKESKGKRRTSMQAPSVTDGLRGVQATEAASPPSTLASVTFADGGKGPAIILRNGSTPWCESWFAQLPPGLEQDDIQTSVWSYGDSDRMTCPKLLNILANVVHPLHRKRATGQLFWVMDGPT